MIDGKVNGDIANSAITENAEAIVLEAKAGLKRMLKMPVPSCFSEV
jgi:hypothetical protein